MENHLVEGRMRGVCMDEAKLTIRGWIPVI